ncbi:connector enhancer of kinase suppressor of ras 2-like [Pomacea canaliculata]|uniref:connector enhancer of kinase suppressor of ras 2-like n=1 Tax=Pomacea canaliculata TaxID=400727 RepID=UPI000D72C518|nr:connector enhancer of kinase suppressor of ras 2-like [Pomacea canaliculata]
MASSLAQYIQFENWTPQEVTSWLSGLDDAVSQYVECFKERGVDGKKLMMLNHADLEKLGIRKLGHQELVLEAVDLLRSFRYTYDTENLQSLALQLGCKSRSLLNEIQARHGENDKNRANILRGEMRAKRLSITVLSYIADLLSTLKHLVSWLDRAPFEGIYDICRLRNSIVKLGLDLVIVTQRESSFVDPEDAIMKTCRVIMETCDGLVMNSKDPLVVQPASLELAIIRKKQGEELGMNIQSAYNGVHAISSIKELSPADMCSKIEKGDEVLQVNGQTVLGWQLQQLVRILKDKPKEVTLLLKKRPRHINPLGAMANHKRLAAKHTQQAATLPKSLKKRRSREGDAKQARPLLQDFVPASDIYITKDSPANDGDGNDTDNDVFRSGSESPQYTLPVMPDAKHRRATVSGGSPTFERPLLIVEDLDAVIRPKSQAINQAERHAALAALAAAENTLKLSMGDDKKGETFKLVGNGKIISATSENGDQHKVATESETDDSVFASDKEDKDPPGIKPVTSIEVKRQEFRVTKPKPVLLEMPSNKVSAMPEAPRSAGYLTSSHSSRSKNRPPSPVSAPPKRKKPPSTASMSPKEGVTKRLSSSEEKRMELQPLEAVVADGSASGLVAAYPVESSGATMSLPPDAEAANIVNNALAGKNSSAGIQRWCWRPLRLSPDNRPLHIQWGILTEVATDTQTKDMPQLMKIKKLDSPKAAEPTENSPQEISYTHIIAGGVVQKIPTDKAHSMKVESPPVRMRQKSGNRRLGEFVDRRVSCKDLGKGDCEGWLYKRKEKDRVLAKHWSKRWCVLKDLNLYYYKDKNDLKAEGVIYLPAFQVSPVPTLKTKKFLPEDVNSAFKVHNSGTAFYFASERQDDMSKWMNKMGLAAISFDTSNMVTTGGFIKPEPRSNHLGMANIYYSESEEK